MKYPKHDRHDFIDKNNSGTLYMGCIQEEYFSQNHRFLIILINVDMIYGI